jgi:hypothetical protein
LKPDNERMNRAQSRRGKAENERVIVWSGQRRFELLLVVLDTVDEDSNESGSDNKGHMGPLADGQFTR